MLSSMAKHPQDGLLQVSYPIIPNILPPNTLYGVSKYLSLGMT